MFFTTKSVGLDLDLYAASRLQKVDELTQAGGLSNHLAASKEVAKLLMMDVPRDISMQSWLAVSTLPEAIRHGNMAKVGWHVVRTLAVIAESAALPFGLVYPRSVSTLGTYLKLRESWNKPLSPTFMERASALTGGLLEGGRQMARSGYDLATRIDGKSVLKLSIGAGALGLAGYSATRYFNNEHVAFDMKPMLSPLADYLPDSFKVIEKEPEPESSVASSLISLGIAGLLGACLYKSTDRCEKFKKIKPNLDLKNIKFDKNIEANEQPNQGVPENVEGQKEQNPDSNSDEVSLTGSGGDLTSGISTPQDSPRAADSATDDNVDGVENHDNVEEDFHNIEPNTAGVGEDLDADDQKQTSYFSLFKMFNK